MEKQEVEATSSTMFLLMLASVSCQSSAKSYAAKSKTPAAQETFFHLSHLPTSAWFNPSGWP
ncbi:hypothetical protein QTO34_014252 [Cnephaeus nilssonii]|uniref:Uncharacterized protein n=1 Tax=Cnephaeus nilssonii TaxID=3371016 RepID=A0AA40I665_CNENI|nr:hypothetical protein QTO34_014252 [Eptesicus nilssonii]